MNTLTVPAVVGSLERISDWVLAAAARAGLTDHAAWQTQLAVDEAATNIIQHAYAPEAPGTIELAWETDEVSFIVTLKDYGRGFHPEDVPSPDLVSPLEDRKVGGLGLFLMHQLMDEVQFSFDSAAGNTLRMSKRLPAPPMPPPTIVELAGRIDAARAPSLASSVRAMVGNDTRHVLIDFSRVTFLSSSGLRALLLVRKELLARGGELRLCCLLPQVLEVFALTGFTQVFLIHATRDEAIASFSRS